MNMPTPRPPIPPVPERRRLVDFTMPVPWLVTMIISFITSMVGLGWMAANQSNKLTQLLESQAQIVRKQDDIALRADDMRERVSKVETTQQLLALRLNNIEREKK